MADKQATLLLRIKTAGEETLEKVSGLFGQMSTIGLAAFGALSAAVVKGISEYSQQEQAVNALTRTMVNNGVYSKQLKDAYIAQAEALSKVTLFGDEQIIQAQASFSQQARGIKLTDDATKAILDFAQAQGIDAANAAEVVGKSVGTSTNALARYGIEVSATASKSEKMTQVLAGLNSKFGGQAEAATSGLGSLQMLSKSVGELFENLGSKLAPTVTWVAKEFLKLTETSPFVENFTDSVGSAFRFVTKVGLNLIGTFDMVGTAIGGTFGTIAGSLELLVKGKFSAAKDALTSGFNDMYEDLGGISAKYAQKANEIDATAFESKKVNMEKEEQMLMESLNRKNQIKEEDRLKNSERDLQNMIAESELKNQMDLALFSGRQSAIQAAEIAAADRRYQMATTQADKHKALQDKHRATELANEAKFNEAKEAARKESLSTISSLANSGNKELAAIGKAAALTQIAIETPVAISKALASAPPPFNFALAAGVGLAMAAQTAKVAGIPLAEGGIVMPRPGGTQATIGEAGQAEAVIPLDRAGEFGLGGGGTNVVINVNGGLMGSEIEAREFALAIDKELFKLRKNNESISFDSGVI